MTLRNEKILEIIRGSTRLHSVENSLWKGLWNCRNTDYRMNEWISFHHSSHPIHFRQWLKLSHVHSRYKLSFRHKLAASTITHQEYVRRSEGTSSLIHKVGGQTHSPVALPSGREPPHHYHHHSLPRWQRQQDSLYRLYTTRLHGVTVRGQSS